MIRKIKNLLERRRKAVDESMIDWRYRVGNGYSINWKQESGVKRDPEKFIPEICSAEVPDIPSALLRHYETKMLDGVNVRARYRLSEVLRYGCPIGNYEQNQFEGRNLKNATIDEAIKLIAEAQNSGYFSLKTWYPVQRHQVFEGQEDERHYLDLQFDFVRRRTNAVGKRMYDTAMYPRSVTIDFLMRKEDK